MDGRVTISARTLFNICAHRGGDELVPNRSTARSDRRRLGSMLFSTCAAFGLVLSGCGPHTTLPYPNYFEATSSDSAPEVGPNALNDYQSAAEAFVKNLRTHRVLLERSSFSPTEQEWIEAAATEPLKRLKEGLQKPCHIPYAPPGSKESGENRPAWRLLARVLIWRIQKACEERAFGGAIETGTLASKFGFDLSAGMPLDASLGLLTVDDTRKALAVGMNEMSVEQLDLLARSMKTVFLNRPSMKPCFDAAKQDALSQVQAIQNAYRDENYDALDKQLGSAAHEVIPILKELHGQSESRRVAFFEGFAQQAKDDSDLAERESRLPAAERIAPAPAIPASERPWKKVARRVLGIGKPLLGLCDATEARTELLILEAEILRIRKTTGKAPSDLSKFSMKLTIDPYSGQQFIYRTDGSDYKLYSVGADLIDNDGETDDTFTSPDLKLERSPN